MGSFNPHSTDEELPPGMPDTRPTVLDEFKDYADFSVRVDRFFNVINSYSMHHNAIKHIYHMLPSWDKCEAAFDSEIDEDVKMFLLTATNRLGYMATTNIFNDESDQAGGDLPEDALNFAFYTCYCFQWSLFEDFVKTMVRKVIDAGVLQPPVVKDLETKWRQTKQFFDKIESGDVFGRSPFTALLPAAGWMPSFDEYDYKDLNEIRVLRNQFIHGVESPEITSENILLKQRRYERSMWILRKFAENIQFDVQRALAKRGG